MKLKIENIGKIRNAEIELQGITVIAGNNNTGKSTFGKSLYCMFNAFYDAEKKIHEEKKNAKNNIILSSSTKKAFEILTNYENDLKTIINKIIEDESISNDVKKDMQDKLKNIDSIPSEEIQKNIITRFFRTEFQEKINHANYPKDKGKISMFFGKNNETTRVNIDKNECINYSENINIISDSIYIDSPFIMDKCKVNQKKNNEYEHSSFLLKKLCKSINEVGIINEILYKQKMEILLSKINSIVNGELIEDMDLLFKSNDLNTPIGMLSVSTGLKPFLIIKRLLELGQIKERGVLIFDEPEVHLHPEWQLKFAELLVLLQKEFNLTLLLNTHSPYFLNAIEVFSEKHKISENCRYYLAENAEDTCKITDATNNIDIIYQKLAAPFQILENIRYGVNKNE